MRPKHRPPRPKHPKFTHFHRSGLRFGRFPAQRRSIGGVGRHRRAWLRCRWAAAGPGRASRRRTKPHVSTPGTTGVEGTGGPGRGAGGWRRGLAGLRADAPSHTSAHQAPPVWRAPEGSAAVPVGGGGAWLGFETTRRAAEQRPGPTGVEGAGGSGGPGRGAGGWRQGQGGPRDRPLRAQLACGDLAGGPPPTGTHSGRTPQSSPAPQQDPTAPGTPVGATSNPAQRAPDNGYDSETSPRGSRRDRPR